MDVRSYEEVYLSSETLPESAIAIVCNTLLALVAIGFMSLRATISRSETDPKFHIYCVHWYGVICPTSNFSTLPSLGFCIVSVFFQIQALRSIVSVASGLHGSGVSEIVAARAIDSVQDQYRGWRTAQFMGSVAASVLCTSQIVTRMIVMRAKASKRQHPRSCEQREPPIHHIHRRNVVLDSFLPFTMVAVAGILLRGRVYDNVLPAAGQLERTLLPASDLNHLTHVIWNHSSALGSQLILFQILSGRTWLSNPVSLCVP
ncbi:hypothetical protein BKA70DRAFT_1521250 [Coprinopsis sp. MPI-PUGE-AT-0042]|nr:hypothetical protein BKA70DRAFT_1521250 [Coprinopsis sp. MPI-PUGE-AT-0042]